MKLILLALLTIVACNDTDVTAPKDCQWDSVTAHGLHADTTHTHMVCK